MKTMQNAVTLSGHLGTEIAIKQVGAGQRMARMPLATNEYYRDQSGSSHKDTQWHQLVAWGTIAERMQRELGKGAFVIVHGKLVTRKFLTQAGDTRHVTEVVVREFTKMSSGKPTQTPQAA